MRTLFIIFFWLTTIMSYSKVFVPQNGTFIEKSINVEKQSINNIVSYLGYNSDQFYSYFNFDSEITEITAVIFKVFTSEIICIITDESVEKLDNEMVKKYLSAFDQKKEFDSYDIEKTLNDGIKNKSLSSKFLADVLKVDLPDPNGTMIATKIGYEIEFTKGIISKYYPSDGLNKWAKGWKIQQPDLFQLYERTAAKYRGNDTDKIIQEINIQADAFSRIPDGFQNEYLEFYRTAEGTINFKMILVSHYKEQITLQEFKEINQGRFQLTDEFSTPEGYKRTTYKLINTLYTFSQDGKLISTYLSE